MTVLPHAAHAGNPAAGPAPAHPPAPRDANASPQPTPPAPLPPHLATADPARVELFRRRHALVNSTAYRDLHLVVTLARRLAKQLRHVRDTYSPGEAGRVLAAAGLDPDPPEGVSWTADQFDAALADCAGVAWVVEQFAGIVGCGLPPAPVGQEGGAR